MEELRSATAVPIARHVGHTYGAIWHCIFVIKQVISFASRPDMMPASNKLWLQKLHVMSQCCTCDASVECSISAHLKHQGFVLRLDLIPLNGNACAWLGRIAAGCSLEGSLSSQQLSPLRHSPRQKLTKIVCKPFVCNGKSSRVFVPCHLMNYNGMYDILLVEAG